MDKPIITEQQVKDKAIERFWSKIQFDESDKCWNWTAGCNVWGYAHFYVRKDHVKDTTVKSSRFMYKVIFGEFTQSLDVCHTCDNRKCVNPNHLWLGTDKDNARDRDLKGRGNPPKGESHHWAKITEENVIDIKKRLAAGETQRSIASYYNINFVTVGEIKRGNNWKHILPDMLIKSRRCSAKLTEDQVRQIKKRLLNGEVQRIIAESYSVTRTAISMIQRGLNWKHVII